MASRNWAISGSEMVMSVFRQQKHRGLALDTVATGLRVRFGLGVSESAEAIEEAIDVHGLMCVWGFIYNPLQDGLQDTLDDTEYQRRCALAQLDGKTPLADCDANHSIVRGLIRDGLIERAIDSLVMTENGREYAGKMYTMIHPDCEVTDAELYMACPVLNELA